MKSSIKLILVFLLLFSPVFLSAGGLKGAEVSVLAGTTLDIAPFGLEQAYFTVQGDLSSPGRVSLGFRPSLAYCSSSRMLRLPVTLNYTIIRGFFRFTIFGGGGLELYRSDHYNISSPLLTGGFSLSAGCLKIEIPAVTARRYYNTDSDISILFGFNYLF